MPDVGKITTLISGLLFGAGVTISGMVNPMKVLNFLDITGQWDASLVLVMAAGLAVTLIGYQLVFRNKAPLFSPTFKLPTLKKVDLPLVAGAALFGVGWGLSGFCPGPAVASLVFGNTQSFIFVAAMAVGMIATRQIKQRGPAS